MPKNNRMHTWYYARSSFLGSWRFIVYGPFQISHIWILEHSFQRISILWTLPASLLTLITSWHHFVTLNLWSEMYFNSQKLTRQPTLIFRFLQVWHPFDSLPWRRPIMRSNDLAAGEVANRSRNSQIWWSKILKIIPPQPHSFARNTFYMRRIGNHV